MCHTQVTLAQPGGSVPCGDEGTPSIGRNPKMKHSRKSRSLEQEAEMGYAGRNHPSSASAARGAAAEQFVF